MSFSQSDLFSGAQVFVDLFKRVAVHPCPLLSLELTEGNIKISLMPVKILALLLMELGWRMWHDFCPDLDFSTVCLRDIPGCQSKHTYPAFFKDNILTPNFFLTPLWPHRDWLLTRIHLSHRSRKSDLKNADLKKKPLRVHLFIHSTNGYWVLIIFWALCKEVCKG